MRKALITGAIAAMLLLGVPAFAHASVRLVPSKIDLQVTPGQEASFTMTLRNGETTPLSVTASAWDFARDAKGEPRPITGSEAATFRGCADWLVLDTVPVVASAGKDAIVPVVLHIPSDAAPGTHFTYVSVLASPTDTPGDSIPVGYNVNALVMLTVVSTEGVPAVQAGTLILDRTVSVAQFTVPATAMNGSAQLGAVLVNTGNVHANVKTRFEILNGSQVVDSIPVKQFTLLPGDRYPLTATWSELPLLGSYTARFVAEVEGGKPLTAESGFWVVSWTAIYIALGVLGALGALVLLLRKFVHIEIRRADAQPAAN